VLSQALAEMKEKIKILLNEVEILRNESLAKDKALAKERSQHLASQVGGCRPYANGILKGPAHRTGATGWAAP